MLTLKQISEETERVIAGLEKKHFNGAKEAIDNALAIDKKRREAQQKMDNLLSEQKKAAGNIGKLMKEGKKEEAENAKKAVAALKEESKSMQDAMEAAEKELTALLCTIPNIPYDEVPEGASAEDNHVVKSNLKECTPNDTVGNWDANPVIESAKLPHWELAKKYNLIDFDLGVKISGAGFPVYIGMGARLQRALINFFLDEARASGYTEIMPARPTISEHRHPMDSIFKYVNKDASLLTKLNIKTIIAAEQQTMNYYMNISSLYSKSDVGRRLYIEIGMIEEEHVSQYESLKDTTVTWLEDLLMHEYTECYLYYSCMMTECDAYIRRIWEECLHQEIAHLHKANELLCKYENRDWQSVIPCGDFPELLKLESNIDYVRQVIATTTGNTQFRDTIVPLGELCSDADFFRYQSIVNHNVCCVASHQVIDNYIRCKGKDYRYEVKPSPICELQNRTCDNTSLGRDPQKTPSKYSVCGTTKNNCQCPQDTNHIC